MSNESGKLLTDRDLETIQGDNRKIYQVSEITRRIKLTLEDEFGILWVEGELSNVKRYPSGHVYATLKDEDAQISAVLFKGNQRGIQFDVKDGLKVRAQGQISVYAPRGQYQLIIRKLEEAGKGDLQKAFEELKKRLSEEGLFDPERKQAVPVLPQHIGVVTSPAGAAIRDILNVLTRRFPNVHLQLAPVQVQGEAAAGQIAAAIDLFNERGGIDVLIVGRGGGSLEDLWPFNEEIVARAVARSDIPIISAVGHEIDFTISDFVADLRAPTPSAAAELVVGQKEAFEEAIRYRAKQLARALEANLLAVRNRFTSASRSYVFREPAHLIGKYRQRIESRYTAMRYRLEDESRKRQQVLDELGLRLTHRTEVWANTCGQDLERLASQLRALSPSAVLERGYSVTRDRDGNIIRTVDQVEVGEPVKTQLARGTLESEITAKREGKGHGRKKD